MEAPPTTENVTRFDKMTIIDGQGVGTTFTFALNVASHQREAQRMLRKGWKVYRHWTVEVRQTTVDGRVVDSRSVVADTMDDNLPDPAR